MLTRDGHCTEGIEALRVGRVCVVLADRFPAVPFGGSNSFIHSMGAARCLAALPVLLGSPYPLYYLRYFACLTNSTV